MSQPAAAPDLAVFYEHPAWFQPLFAALDRRGVSWASIAIQDHLFDPADLSAPAPLITRAPAAAQCASTAWQ